ncbi:MAG TPA: hypothetical protein VEF76_07790 [Patescibacteria group bacterium]|nr:hypothetical protein [Patescibacteria group bacterium]
MLWEVMIEMVMELMKVMGEILKTLGSIIASIFKHFTKKKPGAKPGKPGGPDASAGIVSPPAKSKGELVLICAVLGLVGFVAMMIPQVRGAVFGKSAGSIGGVVSTTDRPRNELPMGQYTAPQFFKKKKFVIEEPGSKRTVYYYWYAPIAEGGQKLPIVVVLHDKDGLSPAATYLRSAALQKKYPSYLLIPMAPKGKVWDSPVKYSGQEFPKAELTPPAPEGARALRDAVIILANLTEHIPVDESRMYVVGCDEGASGVLGAAAHYPGIFAGGVAIAGKWSFLDSRKMAGTPLLLLHGLTDKALPPQFSDNMARVVRAAGGKAAFHAFPATGHDCEAPIFYSGAVWNWLFSQQRQAPPAAPAAASVH